MEKEKQFEDVMGKLKQFEDVMGKIKQQEVKATPTVKDVVKTEKQEVSVKTKPYEWRPGSHAGGGGEGCFVIFFILVVVLFFMVTNPIAIIFWLIILWIPIIIISEILS